nr:DUF551 domain-containing protein [Klebsiella quasipneumoniae]
MVPMRLTAENGAKGALSGEFSETKFVNCSECFGDDECETCDGSGRIEITVPVSWTTIKEIWAKGVEHFAAAPQPQNAPQNIPEIIPNELIAAVNRLLDSDGSRGCYSAIKCYDAHIEVERLLAAAPQLPGSEPATVPGKWIPVSERMPDENADQQVLACFKGGDISALYYSDGRWDDAYGIVPIRQDVTHWMQLPAAPQEVKGE